MKLETRVLTVGNLEVRQLEDGRREYRGDAIRFDEPSENLGGFVEFVDNDIEIASPDVRHLINHDANLVLGRTTAGTTRLERSGSAVTAHTDLPDTSYARDLEVSIERRDVDQMSFGFRVVKRSDGSDGDVWDFSTSPATRHLRAIELHDVSTVTYPAYPTTTAEVRSLLAKNGVRAVGPAVVAFDSDDGMCDYMDDIDASLPDDSTGWGYVSDCSADGTSALVVWYAPGGDGWECYAVPVVLDDQGEPSAAPRDAWVAVDQAYIVADDSRALRAIGRELRSGKAISAENADRVRAIAEAHSSMGEHISALSDAAGLSGEDDDDTSADGGSSTVDEYNALPRSLAGSRIRIALSDS